MDEGYLEFSEFLEHSSGICLGHNKQYLVTSRLRTIMKDLETESLHDLLSEIKRDARGKLKNQVVDAMTTNETLWFRDSHPFDIMKRIILPEHFENSRAASLRIWSAACSTGQEPYSLSMTMDEYGKMHPSRGKINHRIVATDISPTALEEAKSGEYAMLALGRGLDAAKIKTYFDEQGDGRWKVKRDIAQSVEFRSLNLKDSFAALGKFDVVFCRNVLIYFTAELKKDILSRIHGTLKKDGYLVVGASEAVNGLADKYEMVHCRTGIIYRAI